MNFAISIIIIIFAFTFTSCSSKESAQEQTEQPSSDFFTDTSSGVEIFTKKMQGANEFTCSTCHSAASAPDDGFRTVGHDLTNAFFRSTYKNGQLNSLREAVNNCVEHWMVGTPFAEDQTTWNTLSSWFESQNTTDTSNLVYNIISPPATVTGGDSGQGMLTFDQTLSLIHISSPRDKRQSRMPSSA